MVGLESKETRECCFVIERDAWLRGEMENVGCETTCGDVEVSLMTCMTPEEVEYGRMILESVEHGPLLWPSVTEDGVTRLKKYSKLSSAEAIQADCDVKATNIILQALLLKIYALVSTYKVAKDLWERIQMLMQGTSLTKQERECKLYDAFDKFAYQKGETLHDFYLRFSLLLNDMNMYNMKLEQFQVNTKFLNINTPEWRSKGTSGRQRVIVCYNCKGEGHMAKQYTKPKRKHDAEWFKDKFQVKMKFLNILHPEWSKFFTDAKL
nr:hypothetical protein [Tanacetum cinerariifolium]